MSRAASQMSQDIFEEQRRLDQQGRKADKAILHFLTWGVPGIILLCLAGLMILVLLA